jgi:hypothetical protein
VRSHSVAVGLSIPGFASPVLFTIGGWMYREGQMVEARDEEEGVQGIDEESG